MSQFRTPLVSKFRKDSATVYTFGSAIEDIGLNINERNNQVRLTNYVLLNLPTISFSGGDYGEISADKIVPAEDIEKFKTPAYQDYTFPSMLQNYVLNFETRLRNQSTYDFSASQTVTEKVFWKWLQKTGALALKKYTGPDGEVFYHEDFTNPDKSVIKGFGQVASSSQSSNTYNMNNETYIMIPSSYGQMKYYMSEAFDTNYTKGKTYFATNTNYLEGFSTDDLGSSSEDSFLYHAWADTSAYDYVLSKDTDGLQFEFDINDIRKYIKHENETVEADDLYYDRITYDNIAIDSSLCLNQKYQFNTILLYYTIYDKNGNNLATNLFGIMVLDSTNIIDGANTYGEPLNITFHDTNNPYIDIPASTTDVSVFVTEDYPYNAERVIGIELGSEKKVDFKTKMRLNGVKKISFSVLSEKTEKLQFDLKFARLNSDTPNPITETMSLYTMFNDGGTGGSMNVSINGHETGNISFSPNANKDKEYYEITFTPNCEEINSMLNYTPKDYLEGFFVLTLSTPNLAADTKKKYFGRLGNIKFEFNGEVSPIANRTFLEIPPILKKQTTSGSFGSEYSFRVNLQTASIYDKDSSIYDYSTAEASTITDFNSVLTNLKNAVDILKKNAIVIYGIYTDNQGIKQLVANSVDKVNGLEKNVNDILYGNVRNISSDKIDTNTIKAKTIDASLSFADENGNIHGQIDGSVLRYNNIDASTINLSDVTLTNVTIGGEGLTISNGDKNVMRVDSNGNIYIGGEEANFKESIGKWYFCKVGNTGLSDTPPFEYVYELLVSENINEIIKFIIEDTNVDFKGTGLTYEEYLKRYWTSVLNFYIEHEDNSEYVNKNISPYPSKNCKFILTNGNKTDVDGCAAVFGESVMEFNEYVKNLNQNITYIFENTIEIPATDMSGGTINFVKKTIKRYREYIGTTRDNALSDFQENAEWSLI